MRKREATVISNVALPWSEGLLTAKTWRSGARFVVAVPELGLHCYGKSQSEAVFRLFSSLLKYYRQLKDNKERISKRGSAHLSLLSSWVAAIEKKMQVGRRQPAAAAPSKS